MGKSDESMTSNGTSLCVLENPCLNMFGSVRYYDMLHKKEFKDGDLINSHKSVLFSVINTSGPEQVKSKSYDTARIILLISMLF